jgi:hypothetical protein
VVSARRPRDSSKLRTREALLSIHERADFELLLIDVHDTLKKVAQGFGLPRFGAIVTHAYSM